MKSLFALFDEIGLPCFRQGSMSDADYQPSFFTFWNIDTSNKSFYDNAEKRYIELVQVGFYTNDADLIYSQLDEGGEFYKKAKEKGFVFKGRAKDADADKKDYFGRVCVVQIINKTEG